MSSETRPRLSTATLDQLPIDVARPSYDRDTQAAGVVHLGVGAFFRAHQAVYLDALMALGDGGWMVHGASLRSPAVAEQLNPQDGLYTVLVRSGEGERAQICGSLRSVCVASEDPKALIDRLGSPETELVTLTITEKGYCLDPATGRLNLDDPAIRYDIATPAQPRSAPGFLVMGLRARRLAGLHPFTVLSCDNKPHNGQLTRAAVLDLARAMGEPDLADWIEQKGAFPSSMVDRIVPATTPEDIEALSERIGVRDAAMVKTEPFSQWVVEDWFCGRRPPLERVGAQMTQDVAGWEKGKLRLLNGAHSAMAYLGALAGLECVHDAIAAPGFRELVDQLWDEAAETLDRVEGFDPAAYQAELTRRFTNPALRHRLVQIAMDGSQKIPQRQLNVILERRQRGLPSPMLTLAVAGWVRWQFGVDELGRTYEVSDPLAVRTREAIEAGGGDPGETARHIVQVREIFGDGLRDDETWVRELGKALAGLMDRGAARTVADLGVGGRDI